MQDHQHNQGFVYSAQQLIKLISLSNSKEIQPDTNVSKALYELQTTYNGVESLAKSLKSDTKKGLSPGPDFAVRQTHYGNNQKLPIRTFSNCLLFLRSFDGYAIYLFLVAILQFIAGAFYDRSQSFTEGVALMIFIAILVAINFVLNYTEQKRSTRQALDFNRTSVISIRDGQRETIDTDQLMVGDIFVVENGQQIPADAILVSSDYLQVDEAAMTGETDLQPKSHVNEENFSTNPDCFLLKGTTVAQGDGLALVIAVGQNTKEAQIQQPLQIKADEDFVGYLLLQLRSLYYQPIKFGAILAVFTLLVLIIRLIINSTNEQINQDSSFYVFKSLNAIIIGITIFIAAIPDGLFLALYVATIKLIKNALRDHCLIKSVGVTQKLGFVNELLASKTGCLTQNKMEVVSIYSKGQTISQEGCQPLFTSNIDRLLVQSVIFGTDVKFTNDQSDKFETGPTDSGLIRYLINGGINIRQEYSIKDNTQIIWKIPFSSRTKRVTIAFRLDNGNVRVVCKGASEILMRFCNKIDTPQGLSDFDDIEKEKLNQVISGLAMKAQRTVGLTYKDYSSEDWSALEAKFNGMMEDSDRNNAVDGNLIYHTIFGVMDTIRPESKGAIQMCHESGINVRMITGDNLTTAKIVAHQAGIISQQELDKSLANGSLICMEGPSFYDAIGGTKRVMTENGTEKESIVNMQEFLRIESQLKVLARARPEDQYMLVTGLMKAGKVVGVISDGTNAAPAVKQADVGFSMGIQGTDIIKAASDVILTDDSFPSMCEAIIHGRNLTETICKFAQFQITMNFCSITIMFISSCIVGESPLTIVQIVYVNLIMIKPSFFAFANDYSHGKLCNQPPQSMQDNVVRPSMLRNIIGQLYYQIIILLIILFFGLNSSYNCYTLKNSNDCYTGDIVGEPLYWTSYYVENYPEIDLQQDEPTRKLLIFTMVFQTFFYMQIFNQINSRKTDESELNVFQGFSRSYFMIGAIVVQVIAQTLIIMFGGIAFQCAPLGMYEDLICVGLALGTLIWALIFKFIPIRWFSCLSKQRQVESTETSQHHNVDNYTVN